MTFTRRTLTASLSSLPLLGFLTGRARADETPDAALDAVFSNGAATPALGAAIVGKAGIEWSGVRGVRRQGSADAVTLDDRWHLGSNTKAMTAALYARLVEQGRARWGVTLAEAFPDLTLDPAWGDATLDELMHHRGGLLDAGVLGRSWLMTARDDPADLPDQRRAIVARALAAPPAGPRGTFAYGNANYIALGAAIERITGGTWEEAMRAEVFAPLGIASGGFGPPSGDNAWGHLAQKTPVASDGPLADNPLALGPAGTAHMTLADYARFIGVFLNDGAGWLSPDSIRTLTTPAVGNGQPYGGGWGVILSPRAGVAGPGTALAHDGSNTMWYCSARVAPKRGLAVVTVANDGSGGVRACGTLMQRLIALKTAA